MIEVYKFGGTCLTRGCIPAKILVHPANLIRESQHAKKLELHLSIKPFLPLLRLKSCFHVWMTLIKIQIVMGF